VKEHLLRREQRLAAPIAQVFPFFADAGNLQRITPPEVGFQIETPLPVAMRIGTLLDYRLRLFGVPFRWRTEITGWDPPHGFIDEQVRGPYRLWRHVHRFEADGDDTKMIDEVYYALPLAPVGEIAHFVVRAQLDRIFDFRARAVPEMVKTASV
jgi:ligand-binding SRPBCC domain-containing protein